MKDEADKKNQSSQPAAPRNSRSFAVMAFDKLLCVKEESQALNNDIPADPFHAPSIDFHEEKEERKTSRPYSIFNGFGYSNTGSTYAVSSNINYAREKETKRLHRSMIRVPTKNKNRAKATHDINENDDARSQISEATNSSVFTSTLHQAQDLLGRITQFRRQTQARNRRQQTTNFLSSEGDLLTTDHVHLLQSPKFSKSEGDLHSNYSHYSGRKSTKYRNKRKSVRSLCATDTPSSSDVGNPTQRVSLSIYDARGGANQPQKLVSTTSSHRNLHVLGDLEPPNDVIGTTNVYASASNSAQDSTYASSPADVALELAGNPATTHVSNLPWRDNASDGGLHGRYSGPVNDLLQPHGEGSLILQNNNFLKFYGCWVDGELASPLMNEDEKRDHDLSLGSNRYSKKSSKELNKKSSSSKERNKGSSKELKDMRRAMIPSGLSGHSTSPKELKPKRRASISSGTSCYSSDLTGLKDSSPRESSASTKSSKCYHRPKPKYKLGDVARTPSDMVIHQTKGKATHSVSILKKYDQAFVKRSNGLWTCATLVEKALQPTNASNLRWFTEDEIDEETMELDESMLFVINENGDTKLIKKRHWGRFIRCMQ